MRSLHGFSLNQPQGAEAAGGGEKRVTEEQRGWRGHPACIWTSGLSEGQILPGQLASNPAWSLVCSCKCLGGGTQRCCDPSCGSAGSLPGTKAAEDRGRALLWSMPRLAPDVRTKAAFGWQGMPLAV